MDAEQIRPLQARLSEFLAEFHECFPRRDTRAHFPRYVEGQLSDLTRKSVEPIALKTGVPARTLQEFLSQYHWDEELMVERLQRIVVRDHASPHSIGIIDETSFVKKGDKTPGVQRQHCGAVGKIENCIVTVHLGYAADEFHCLLDGDLFLPESWSDDRQRCRDAQIPDEVVYRPKTEIALELYDRARANGVVFEWLTFDEWYGSKPPFLRALQQRQQKSVGEVHKHFAVWIEPPRVTDRPYRRGRRGRGRKTPRLVAGSEKPQHVEDLLAQHPALRDRPWTRWHVKDGDKGPEVWETKHLLVNIPDENDLPSEPLHLLVARNILDPTEIKFFIGLAPLETPVSTLLLVAFSRWRVERCFEDQKGEIGLDHYEGRRWSGLQRHLVLSAVSYLFLARVVKTLRGKKTGVDGVSGPHRPERARTHLLARPSGCPDTDRPSGRGNRMDTEAQCTGAQEPHKDDLEKTAAAGHHPPESQSLSVGQPRTVRRLDIAL